MKTSGTWSKKKIALNSLLCFNLHTNDHKSGRHEEISFSVDEGNTKSLLARIKIQIFLIFLITK